MANKIFKTLVSASAFSLVAGTALAQTGGLQVAVSHTSPSHPNTGCGLVDLKNIPTGRDYAAIQGTIAKSCDETPSMVEYTGQGKNGVAILDTLWKVASFGIVADDRYRMMTYFIPNMQQPGVIESKFLIKYEDDYVAIEANNVLGKPTLVEVLNNTGTVIMTKRCLDVDITAGKTENCTVIAPFVDTQSFFRAESQSAQDAKDYVAFLAAGKSLTVPYYDDSAARARLTNIKLFVQAAKATPQ